VHKLGGNKLEFRDLLAKSSGFTTRLSSILEMIACAGLLGMMVVGFIDVVGAKLFKWPLPGSMDVVYMLQVVAMAGAWSFAQIDGRHVRVDFLEQILPKRVGGFLNILTSLFGVGLFILIGWQSYEFGLFIKSEGVVTNTAQVPLYPFALWIALCCIAMCLVLIRQLANYLVGVLRD